MSQPGKLVAFADGTAPETTPDFAERHYSIAEIARLWNFSEKSVRRIFEDEPDVIVLGDLKSTGRKRRYVTLRIPERVAARVYRRMQQRR